MIDDLINFQFPEFTPEFLSGMKEEIPSVLDIVKNMDFDFEGDICESDKYEKRVLSRAIRAKKRAVMIEIERLSYENENNGTNHELPRDIQQEILFVDEANQKLANDDFRKMEWKKDAGERSRRIYEWWRKAMTHFKNKIPKFTEALIIIVTVQPSSAASERVFSQLNFIRRAIGDKALNDLIELRCFLRCNKGLGEDYLVN